MANILLLDCTLRDGGYLNDWEFSYNGILSIYERLVMSNVDIIEMGFIDARRPYDINRTIFPNTKSINNSLSAVSVHPKTLVGMIDYGTCDICNVQDCKDCVLDGIRVIFHKHDMREAMEFIGQLKAKGYKTFAQLVAISEYDVHDIENISKLAEEIRPTAVSMVDTYGLLYPQNVSELFRQLDARLPLEISIGFHAHNNLQLGYANALAFIDINTERPRIVDGTLFGMGKSAGNDPIELVAPYLNSNYGSSYDTDHMLEAIEESIKDIFIKTPWGYRTQFYLSAENSCHPNYVSYLQAKSNLSVSDINNILSLIESSADINRKLYYNKDYIENLYNEYISIELNDEERGDLLAEKIGDRDILIMGPGKNLILQSEIVEDFLNNHHPVIITINYISEKYNGEYVFVTKKSRYQEMTDRIHDLKSNKHIRMIATSNVNPREKDVLVFDREPLLENNEEITDNSFLMLLKILRYAHVKEVYCAGLDGYSDREDNYFQKDMEYSFVKEKAGRLNHHIKEVLSRQFKDMKINFITYSHYIEEDD